MVAVDTHEDDEIAEMELQKTINGTIASVETEVNFLKASLGGTKESPTVTLSLVDTNLPSGALTNASLKTAFTQMQNIALTMNKIFLDIYTDANLSVDADDTEETASLGNNTLGLAAGSENVRSKWSVFVTPYGSYTDNSKYDYDAGTYGVTAGLSYSFSPQFSLGMHFDYNATQSNSNALESNADTFAIGAHSSYLIDENWFVNGSATFAFANNDIDYNAFGESVGDNFKSNSLYAAANVGYVFDVNKNNIIVPEVGLSYLYISSDAYSLAFNNPANALYDLDINSSDYSALFANLMVTWRGNFDAKNGTIKPHLGIGIRQNLTGADIDSSFELFGSRYDTEVSTDATSFLANAGLEWTNGTCSLGLYYDGAFGEDQVSHTGTLKFVYKF